MTTVLTDFVRRMGPDGSEPTRELFEQVWDALRGLLGAEMKRRSVWSSPPVYLGVVGFGYWTSPGPGSDALDELAAQCFEWVFVKRLEGLLAQADRKPVVDGLVALAVHHFVLEAQRQSDPLGFRVFEVLRRAVRHAVDAGHLRIAAGDPRVRNDSLLVRGGKAGPVDSGEIHRVRADDLAASWVADHLDDLVTASHKGLKELVAALAADLVDWLAVERPGVRFGNLAAALKSECRRAWALRLRDAHGIADSNTPTRPPSTPEPELLRRFGRLAECVLQSIRTLDERAKTRAYLERLWRFLEGYAIDEDGEGRELDRLPSHRQIAQLLDIPRDRIPGLLAILGGRLMVCRRKVAASAEEAPMPTPDDPSSPKSRAWAAAREAASRRRRECADEEGAWDGRPEVGDVLIPDGQEIDGVAWLVLEADRQRDRFRCVPVDRFGLLGPRDRRLPANPDEAHGPWSLRADFETWIEGARLRESVCAGRLELGDSAAGPGAAAEEGLQRTDADLPAYRDWIDDGPALARERLRPTSTSAPASTEPSPPETTPGETTPGETTPGERALPFPTRPDSRLWTGWLAAAMALATLGLSIQVLDLRQSVSRLGQPLVNVPYGEVKFDSVPRGTREIYVPADATHVQIGLILANQVEYPRHRFVLSDADGRTIESIGPLPAADEYSITYRTELLEPPPVWLAAYGVDSDGRDTLLDRQEIVLVRGPRP